MTDKKNPELNIVEDKRLKRMHLTVHPQQGVIVRVPFGTCKQKAHEMVAKNTGWVQKQWAKYNYLCPWREYKDGDLLPLLGSRVILARETGQKLEGQWHLDYVLIKGPADADRDQVRQLLSELYSSRAEEYIPRRVREINKEHFHVALGKISVRGQSRILGSCTGAGNLSFNWRLLLAPAAVVDYVIIHELAHRTEMNHSPRFWQLVSSVCPDYVVHRHWIKNNSNLLYI